MPPLTLAALTAAELAAATALETRARGALDAAQAELRDAEATHRATQAQLAAGVKLDAELRRRLVAAAGEMPADAVGLAEDVESATVALRAHGRGAAAAERRLADARRRFEAAGARARERAEARLAAQAAKDVADARQARLDAARSALGAAPLTGVKAAAGAALTGTALQAAEDRLAGDVPAALLERARARLTVARAEIADAIDAAGDAAAAAATAAGTQSGRPATTARARDALAGAERAYLATLEGRAELERAQAMIAAVSAASPMSQDRRDRIAELEPDAAVIALEADRDAKREIVRAKRRALEEKWLAAMSADADADPAADADVQTAQGELDTAQDDLRNAEQALDTAPAAGEPTPREAVGRWEAAVPDETWGALLMVESAKAALTRLDATTPGDLRSALAAAETAYAEALRDEAAGRRAAAELAALAADRAAAAEVAARTTSDLSTARGDA